MTLAANDFRYLIEEHAPALYRLAYRLCGDPHEAEDLLQETLQGAWGSRTRFDPARSVRAWLTSILRRRAIDRWRRRQRDPVASSVPLEDLATAVSDPLASDYTDEMQHALAHLADDVRETLLLVIVGELTHQEAADVLGAPLGTVLSRVSRGRAQLRSHFLSASQRAQSASGG